MTPRASAYARGVTRGPRANVPQRRPVLRDRTSLRVGRGLDLRGDDLATAGLGPTVVLRAAVLRTAVLRPPIILRAGVAAGAGVAAVVTAALRARVTTAHHRAERRAAT
ncbi:MAG TPA: hypothetical protein VF796_18075, partial [Humisphaera sp.]